MYIVIVLVASLTACSESPSTPTPSNSSGSTNAKNNSTSPPGLEQKTIDAALEAAQQYLDNDELSNAETILLRLLEKAPDEVYANEMLARLAFRRGTIARDAGNERAALEQFQIAYSKYEDVIAQQPDVAGFHQNAGEFAISAGQTDRALKHFQQAGALDPTNLKHPLYEAQVLLQQDQVAQARAAIERVLALDADQPYGLATLASIQMAEGETEGAVASISEARELVTDDVDRLSLRIVEARLLRQAGQPERALDLLLPLDSATRRTLQVTSEIAASHLAMGEPLKALEVWQTRYQRTSDWRAARGAAACCLAAERVDDAWVWYRRAQLDAPLDDAELAAMRAQLEEASGE